MQGRGRLNGDKADLNPRAWKLGGQKVGEGETWLGSGVVGAAGVEDAGMNAALELIIFSVL